MYAEKLRVGFVGAGYMASEYARVLRARPSWEIVGVVGRSEHRASEFSTSNPGSRSFPTVSQMVSTCDPHLVIVAVPELETLRVLQAVWEHPVTCLVEKPAGHNLEQARLASSRSLQARGPTFLALNRRYYESVQCAMSMLSRDGGSRLLTLVDQHDTRQAAARGQPQEVLNNWHFANAIHTVDLLRVFARGHVETVETFVWSNAEFRRDVESRILFSSGDRATYSSFWNLPNTWSLNCVTSAQRLVLAPLEQGFSQKDGERSIAPMLLKGRDLEFKPGLSNLVDDLERHFAGTPSSLVELEEGLESMELVSRIFGNGSAER